LRRIGLAGAASVQLVDGVVPLRPEEAMAEAMLQGGRAQQTARGLRAKTIDARERLVRRFLAFTNEFPWQWSPSHVDEWTLTLSAEHHLAPATVRGYQTGLRLFSEYLTDARYGWVAACEEAFGTFPAPICHWPWHDSRCGPSRSGWPSSITRTQPAAASPPPRANSPGHCSSPTASPRFRMR
jgi:integrase/recombinase XerC